MEEFVDSIMTVLKSEEQAAARENAQDDAKWSWIRELVTVLVYYEILKRRNKKKNYYIF